PRTETPAAFTAIQVGLLALVAVSFIQVAMHYDGPGFAFRNVFQGGGLLPGGGGSSTQDFIDAINDSQRSFDESMMAVDDANTSQKAIPKSVSSDIAKSIDK